MSNCSWELGTPGPFDNGTAAVCSVSNQTNGDSLVSSEIPIVRIITCSVLFFITILTTLGNLVVLLGFVIEKSLTYNNHFNYYIINLAITDLLVAVTAMSFYTADVLLGYWPFGEFMCGIWVFCDYGMTFASVFTLVAISGDRFWSVTWAIHYRMHNTKRKTFLAISMTWIAVLVVWLGPCISDRIKWSEPNFCKWEPSKNQIFVIFVAIIGHHTPCAILVFCYIKVAMAMEARRGAMRSKKVGPAGGTSVSTTVTSVGYSDSDEQPKAPKQTEEKDKEKKIFITLSYIILTYLACWVPFHIVFDISSIDASLVPEPVFTATFWLTYFNSTLNPFLYAYSNKDFRQAFKRVIKCQWRSQRGRL